MVNSISKFIFTPTSTPEHRQVSVGIVDVILGWEAYRQKNVDSACKLNAKTGSHADTSIHEFSKPPGFLDGASSVKIFSNQPSGFPIDTDAASSAHIRSNHDKDDDYCLQIPMIQLLANFLIRLGVNVPSGEKDVTINMINTRLSKRCIKLFQKLVSLFPMQSMELKHLEKLLQNTLENHILQIKQTAQAENPPSDILSASEKKSSLANLPIQQKGTSNSSTLGGLTSDNVLASLAHFLLITLQCRDGPSHFFTSNLSHIVGLLPLWMNSVSHVVQKRLRALLLKVIFKLSFIHTEMF